MTRILLKVSWEALAWDNWFWYCSESLSYLAKTVKSLLDDWIEVALVVWAWNLARWWGMSAWIDRVARDSMWMLAIVMNWIAIKENLWNLWIDSELQSSFEIPWITSRFNKSQSLDMIKSWKVIIFVWGTWNPFFTTDTACVLRALEMDCDFVVKATQVDGLYDKDPNKYEDAKFIASSTYSECLEKWYRVMDQTAFALAREHNMPLKIVSYSKDWAINNAVKWENEWTTITN